MLPLVGSITLDAGLYIYIYIYYLFIYIYIYIYIYICALEEIPFLL